MSASHLIERLALTLIRTSSFGIGFLGPKFSEVTLIGMAYAFEQRTMVRSKILPYLSPRIDLMDVASHAVRI